MLDRPSPFPLFVITPLFYFLLHGAVAYGADPISLRAYDPLAGTNYELNLDDEAELKQQIGPLLPPAERKQFETRQLAASHLLAFLARQAASGKLPPTETSRFIKWASAPSRERFSPLVATLLRAGPQVIEPFADYADRLQSWSSDPAASIPLRVAALETRRHLKDYAGLAKLETLIPTTDWTTQIKILELMEAGLHPRTAEMAATVAMADPAERKGYSTLDAVEILTRTLAASPGTAEAKQQLAEKVNETIYSAYAASLNRSENLHQMISVLRILKKEEQAFFDLLPKLQPDAQESLLKDWGDVDSGYHFTNKEQRESFLRSLPRLFDQFPNLRTPLLNTYLSEPTSLPEPARTQFAQRLRQLLADKSPAAIAADFSLYLAERALLNNAGVEDMGRLRRHLVSEDPNLVDDAIHGIAPHFNLLNREARAELPEKLRKQVAAGNYSHLDAASWLLSDWGEDSERLVGEILSRPPGTIPRAVWESLNRRKLPLSDESVKRLLQRWGAEESGALTRDDVQRSLRATGQDGDTANQAFPVQSLLFKRYYDHLKQQGATRKGMTANDLLLYAADTSRTALMTLLNEKGPATSPEFKRQVLEKAARVMEAEELSHAPFQSAHPALLQALSRYGVPKKEIEQLATHWTRRLFRESLSPERRIFAYETLRQSLPQHSDALERAFRNEVRRQAGLGQENLGTACEQLCRVIDRQEDWFHERYLVHQDNGNAETSMSAAIRVLGLTAITRAEPYCPSAATTLKNILAHAELTNATAQGPRSLKDAAKHTTALLSTSPAGKPADAATAYARGYGGLLLGELSQRSDISPTLSAFLKAGGDQIESDSRIDLQNFRGSLSFGKQGSQSSLFNSYGVGSIALLNHQPSSETILAIRSAYENMTQAVDAGEEKKEPRRVCSFPYDLSGDQSFEHFTSAAGRSLINYLLLYRIETDPEKKELWLTNLEICTGAFAEVSAVLAGGYHGLNFTHLSIAFSTLQSSRAPYYFLPVLPFAFAALREIDNARGSQSDTTRQELLDSLALVQKQNGLTRPNHSRLYPSSYAYNNALSAIALAGACAWEKKQTESTVVRATPTTPPSLDRILPVRPVSIFGSQRVHPAPIPAELQP